MEASEVLKAIQALGEQPKITVNVEVKRRIGEFEFVTGSVFLTYSLAAGVTPDEMLAEYERVNREAHRIAEAEAEASVQRHLEAQQAKFAEAAEQAAIRREAEWQPRPTNVQPVNPVNRPAPSAGDGGRFWERAPKASKRRPGDWWNEAPTHYVLKREMDSSNPRTGEMEPVYKLEFYRGELEHPVGDVLSWQPTWPGPGWFTDKTGEPFSVGMPVSMSKQPFLEDVSITLRVSDKLTNRNNYRASVVEVR